MRWKPMHTRSSRSSRSPRRPPPSTSPPTSTRLAPCQWRRSASAIRFRCGFTPSRLRRGSTRPASPATTATASRSSARIVLRAVACLTWARSTASTVFSRSSAARGACSRSTTSSTSTGSAVGFGVTLQGGSGFRAVATLTGSRVEYRRMDALDVGQLGERFDVALCFGILHRVTDPIALLGALANVLVPGGEIVLETYGSRLDANAPAIEVHEPGEVYARDDFVYWGFSPESLRRLGRIAGLDELEVVDELEIDGHPRILAVLRASV